MNDDNFVVLLKRETTSSKVVLGSIVSCPKLPNKFSQVFQSLMPDGIWWYLVVL